MLDFGLAALGLVLLVAGAECLVRSASYLARAAGIPAIVIGLTIVAFGTSAPELAVNVKAAFSEQTDLAVGNVVGSNIFNILFILGISALVAPLAVTQRLVRLDVPVMIFASLLVCVFAVNGVIGRGESALMLALLALYVTALGMFSKTAAAPKAEQPQEVRHASLALMLACVGVVAGLFLLAVGARWFVSGASTIAYRFGVSELTVGLTLVAAGTSLPEAATSLVASIRGERDIAVGNVVGSNIFNVLGVLALSGVLAPAGLPIIENTLTVDLSVMIVASFLCLPIFVTGAVISRTEGLLLLAFYAGYFLFIVMRATESPHLAMAGAFAVYGLLPATAVFLLVYLMCAYVKSQAPACAMTDCLTGGVLYAKRNARKLIVLVAGSLLLLVGVAMMALPGPATVVIPLALVLLSTEFKWARRLLDYFLKQARTAVRHIKGKDDTQ